MDTRRPQGAAHPFSLGTNELLVIRSWRAGYHLSFIDPLGVSSRLSLPPQTGEFYRTPATREGRRIFSLCILHSTWGTAQTRSHHQAGCWQGPNSGSGEKWGEGGIRLEPRAPDSPSGDPLLLPLTEDNTQEVPNLEPLFVGQQYPLSPSLLPPSASPLLPTLSLEKTAPCSLTLPGLGSLLPPSTREGPGKLGSTQV